ncbi:MULTISPECIES: ferredoxin [unclassified Streptomyces]|uniref:ferredoxin n=1 Tax=unclassified Streptomyces TaxID=2593676 RepID=UPI0037F848CF
MTSGIPGDPDPDPDIDIDIDTERCIGAAMCVLHAPAVFTQNDDGVAALLPADPHHGDATEAVREAVATCPVQAITLR